MREEGTRATPVDLPLSVQPRHLVEMLRQDYSLFVVSTGKKEFNLDLHFIPGRQIPPLDPRENANNGAIKLLKPPTPGTRRCC